MKQTQITYEWDKIELTEGENVIGYQYHIATIQDGNTIEMQLLHDTRLSDEPLNEAYHDKLAEKQFDQCVSAIVRQISAKGYGVITHQEDPIIGTIAPQEGIPISQRARAMVGNDGEDGFSLGSERDDPEAVPIRVRPKPQSVVNTASGDGTVHKGGEKEAKK